MSMFCYQCQEASKGIACKIVGICGKNPEVAAIQDMLIYVAKGISVYADAGFKKGVRSAEVDHFVFDALFTTITNANFDYEAIRKKVIYGLELRDKFAKELENKGISVEVLYESATWKPASTDEIDQKALVVGVLATENEDVRSLRELTIYGLKGMAAYGMHALHLGYLEEAIFGFTFRALVGVQNDTLSADELTALVLETGNFGVQVMALLDKAHNDTYGTPEITKVNIGVGTRPGILISGHDLKDIEQLLEQSENSGVDIYTHSEMLPAHYYPKLKKYKHLFGNYGNAWWKQTEEFESFNGPVLFTTNCIVPPRRKSCTYADKVYTTGSSGFTGFPHIEPDPLTGKKDFSVIIEHAKKCAAPTSIEEGEIVGGFAHSQVIQLADKVVDAVKSGAIKKFFVMGGCDGRNKDRAYYTDFANALPKDTIILTAGCAKFRYNKLPLGDIGGIPRVLDAGQCNDSYSLAIIALKLKEVFGLEDINELPIAYNIAWYEQKAVIVLLALLYLGVKDIHLGPTLPAFLSPNVANVLVKNFGIAPIGTVDADIELFMNA